MITVYFSIKLISSPHSSCFLYFHSFYDMHFTVIQFMTCILELKLNSFIKKWISTLNSFLSFQKNICYVLTIWGIILVPNINYLNLTSVPLNQNSNPSYIWRNFSQTKRSKQWKRTQYSDGGISIFKDDPLSLKYTAVLKPISINFDLV